MKKRAFSRSGSFLVDELSETGENSARLELLDEALTRSAIARGAWGIRKPVIRLQQRKRARSLRNASKPSLTLTSRQTLAKSINDTVFRDTPEFVNKPALELSRAARDALMEQPSNRKALGILEQLLSHPHIQTRRLVARDVALLRSGQFTGGQAKRMRELWKRLLDDGDAYVFLSITEQIPLRQNQRLLKRLVELLEHPEWMVRRLAAEQLLRRRRLEPGATNAIKRWLPGERAISLVLVVGMEMGGELGLNDLRQIIERALHVESPSVRMDAVRMLKAFLPRVVQQKQAAGMLPDEPEPLIRAMLEQLL